MSLFDESPICECGEFCGGKLPMTLMEYAEHVARLGVAKVFLQKTECPVDDELYEVVERHENWIAVREKPKEVAHG